MEAIVDFRVKPNVHLDVQQFRAAHADISEELPQLTEMRIIEAHLQIPREGIPHQAVRQQEIVGFQFTSSDGKDIAQFRTDGFTYNRLKPYTSWADIFPRAMKLWQVYAKSAVPQRITRLALRYLNRIELPLRVPDLGEVMSAPPPIPKNLPQRLSAFLTRVTINDSRRELSAHLVQALDIDPAQTSPALILDIDAFRQKDIEIGDAKIVETFEVLHDFKNEAFFESLTPKAIEGFV